MARGGFIDPKVYLQRAFDKNLPLAEAKNVAIEAALLGRLMMKGRIYEPAALWRIANPGVSIRARPKRPDQIIPHSVWAGLSEEALASWDWDSGCFCGNGDLGYERWERVKLNEAESNALLDRLTARLRPAQSEGAMPPVGERRRGATWDEWVAMVATLAFEHAIDANSTDADILQLTKIRLGLDGASTKRMKSAALAIVAQWKRSPPRQPAPKQVKFTDPMQKP